MRQSVVASTIGVAGGKCGVIVIKHDHAAREVMNETQLDIEIRRSNFNVDGYEFFSKC